MLGTIKILAGDFKPSKNAQFVGDELLIPNGGFTRETISKYAIAELEAATEESVKRIGGTIGWGAAGALVLGPVGLLAGLIMGGKGKEVTFVCALKDGRKFMASTDSKTFTKMQAALF